MGQYYKAVCLDRQEFISPSDYGGGIKLMEHSWLLNPMVAAVMIALSPAGQWHHNRLVWAGDYMDQGLFLEFVENRGIKDHNLYACCHFDDERLPGGIKNIRPPLKDGPMLALIANHDTREFVRLTDLPEEDPADPGWHIHPLPLLTCSGNGRGGGDFHGDNVYIGCWAGDRISAEYCRPDGYTELLPCFTERQG